MFAGSALQRVPAVVAIEHGNDCLTYPKCQLSPVCAHNVLRADQVLVLGLGDQVQVFPSALRQNQIHERWARSKTDDSCQGLATIMLQRHERNAN